MKTLIFLLLPFTSFSQVGFTMSGGHGEVPIVKFDLAYKADRHMVSATFQPNATTKAGYPMSTVAVTYGYIIGAWQPYVGYSTQGLTYGVNRYLGYFVIGAGMQGKKPNVSFGVTTFKIKGKEFFTGNDYAIAALQFISGFSYGLHESIQAGHWGKGNQFWDNSLSWKNKYKDFDNGDTRARFIGSKSALVGFTDGYHLTNLISNTANIATLSFAIGGKEKKNWKVIAKKLIISAAVNRAAFHLSYNHIFK